MSPRALKSHIVALTRRKLPQRMGDLYSEVVLHCLTCLYDDDREDSEMTDAETETCVDDGGEGNDANGVSIGVGFYEQVSEPQLT